MAAIRPLPGVPRIDYRRREDLNRHFLGQGSDSEWPASDFQTMSLRTNAPADMVISAEVVSYRNGNPQHYTQFHERRCSIDAPLAWHNDWHGRQSPLPYGLDIPHNGSLASQWTPIDQDTTCSGGSTWSPRTSDSRSEAEGYGKPQLPPIQDIPGLGIGYSHFADQPCFPEQLAYHNRECASVISPHALQQYPDLEELSEEPSMKPELQEITTDGPYSPQGSEACGPYGRPEQFGQEDEALGSSIQDDSRAPSVQGDGDSAMGDSPKADNDDDYNPKPQRRNHGRRFSQRSPASKSMTPTSRKTHPARNPTSQAVKPTKIAKKTSKSSASSPTGNKNANSMPCHRCNAGFPSESALKKHILAIHTRPFICTFHEYGCSSTVGSKNEWKRHVNVQHMHLETWRCDMGACVPQSRGSREHDNASSSPSGQLESHETHYHEFDRKDLFTQHLKRMHSPAKSASRAEKEKFEDSIVAIQKRCHRRLRLPPTKSICPYCPNQPSFENWDDRVEHVGKHLERGDFDKSKEMEDEALRDWLKREGYLVWKGASVGWKLLDTGKKRKNRGEKTVEDGEEDAEGEDEE